MWSRCPPNITSQALLLCPCPIIARIVNLSLAAGEFPPQLKQSIITPLLKTPYLDKENLSNYRPISNLSNISKIVERVVQSRLTDHLVRNQLVVCFEASWIINILCN